MEEFLMPPSERDKSTEAQLGVAKSIIDEHDKGYALGLYTKVAPQIIATWLSAGELFVDPTSKAVVVVQRRTSPQKVRDFANELRATIPVGHFVIRKVACRRGCESQLRDLLKSVPSAAWFEGWLEHPTDRMVASERGLHPVAVKVRGTSELWGTFAPSSVSQTICEEIDYPTLQRLKVGLRVKDAAGALIQRPPALTDHYSNYNAKHAWSAVALRGYGPKGEAADSGFIAKPIEMTRKWKKENPEKLSWVLKDTPARVTYPEFEPLLTEIPGKHHRIRLMNLAPGGGELRRHTDISDPEAGTRDGKLCRVHIPIITNPDVRFTAWNLNGEQIEHSMGVGEMWYLDTRKPHRAVNGGNEHRVHLVVDVESCNEFRALVLGLSPNDPRVSHPGVDGVGPFFGEE